MYISNKLRYTVGVLFVIAFVFSMNNWKSDKAADTDMPPVNMLTDYKNAEYMIGDMKVRLIDGVAETPVVPGSALKTTTTFFGNEVSVDLNADGRPDTVFLVTQNSGGTGTFYYVVAALDTPAGIVGSHATLIADRIAPQTTEIRTGADGKPLTVVNYADRLQGESFTVQPSLGKSLYLKFDPVSLDFGEVVQNFEGEADSGRMSLSMKKWTWMRATYSDGKSIVPAKAGKFTLTFLPDNRFSATTDCNGVSGSYTTAQNTITFDRMISTLMYCDGSEEAVFTKLLSDSHDFMFTSKGELVLGLKFDSGSVVFK